MSLTLYRMEDTERVRYQIRERRRQEVWDKAAREEEKEKKQIEMIERNRKWREKKIGTECLNSIAEEKMLDEKEQRKQKNIEWRKRKESRSCSYQMSEYGRRTAESSSLSSFLLPLLECPYCQEEMHPPAQIYQCKEGHSLCSKCKNLKNMKVTNYKCCKQFQKVFDHNCRYVRFVRQTSLEGTKLWNRLQLWFLARVLKRRHLNQNKVRVSISSPIYLQIWRMMELPMLWKWKNLKWKILMAY